MLRRTALGPTDTVWRPPDWLQSHQVEAARRVHASLSTFTGALLADAVGLGKTYVALAVATRYRTVVAAVPAALISQWKRVCAKVAVEVSVVSHEALSRGSRPAAAELTIVDEAHRFRNPATRRYDTLAQSACRSHVLLLTATPVVNRAADLTNLLRLFTADDAFATFGASSLERAVSNRACSPLVYATSPVIVARSTDAIEGLAQRLPKVVDKTVVRPASVARQTLIRLLRIVDTLDFSNAADSPESALLRLHLLYRLASSAAACRETVRRHLAYVDRALAAAANGNSLSRATARRIFSSEDDLRLELGDLTDARVSAPTDPQNLRVERDRLANLLDALPSGTGSTPKTTTLVALLKRRSRRKTIVFTAALATAIDLARTLRWRNVAVVGAGRAWIASGRIAVDEALALFAPRARDAPEPPPSAWVSTLIATDLASEGLDLQDADTVIHYDLPWTPLKLQQRVGRIARLGSEHKTAVVRWFAPPAVIERRLHLEARIAEKVRCQLGLSVATTSRVGRARVVNQLLERRERLGRSAGKMPPPIPCHAVVRGPLMGIIALHWILGKATVPELIFLSGTPPRLVYDYAATDAALKFLASAEPSGAMPPETLSDRFREVLRMRLAAANLGPTSQTAKRLARSLVRRAYLAGKRREVRSIAVLDAVLDRLRAGLAVGGERALEELLSARAPYSALALWLDQQPTSRDHRPEFEIVAALFGDGTRESAEDQV